MFAWGNNEHGQIGDGGTTPVTSPCFLESLSQWKIKEIACGANHNLAIADPFQENGAGIWSWGINDYCQLGHSSDKTAVGEPTKIPEMESSNVLLVAAGYFHSMCVITNYIMTDSEKAKERERRKEERDKKMGKGKAVDKMPSWVKKKAMDADEKARVEAKIKKKKRRKELLQMESERQRLQREDNEMRTLYTWGDGGKGQLGHRELYTEAYFKQTNPKGAVVKLRKFTRLDCPRLVESLVGWTTPKELGHISSIKAGGCQSALLTTKGMLMTWGSGENGRLGLGDDKNRSVPTPVTGFRIGKSKKEEQKVVDFAVGQCHLVALTNTRDVFSWGSNKQGQLGHGNDATEEDVLLPKISKSVSKRGGNSVFCGDNHSAMLTDNGEVYTWGLSEGGRLGLNDPPEKVHTPVCMDTLNGVEISSVALGAGHTIALSTMYPADDTIGMTIATSIMTDGSIAPGSNMSFNMSACCTVS